MDLFKKFIKELSLWREETTILSTGQYDNQHFKNIVSMGEPVVPLIIQYSWFCPSSIIHAVDNIRYKWLDNQIQEEIDRGDNDRWDVQWLEKYVSYRTIKEQCMLYTFFSIKDGIKNKLKLHIDRNGTCIPVTLRDYHLVNEDKSLNLELTPEYLLRLLSGHYVTMFKNWTLWFGHQNLAYKTLWEAFRYKTLIDIGTIKDKGCVEYKMIWRISPADLSETRFPHIRTFKIEAGDRKCDSFGLDCDPEGWELCFNLDNLSSLLLGEIVDKRYILYVFD